MSKHSEKTKRVFQVGERVALRKPMKKFSPVLGNYVYLKFGTVKEVLKNAFGEVLYAVLFDGYDNVMDLHNRHFDYEPQFVMVFETPHYVGLCQTYKVSERHITNYRAVTNQTSDLNLLITEEGKPKRFSSAYHHPRRVQRGRC